YSNLGLQNSAMRKDAKQKTLALLNRAEKLNPSAPSLRLKLAEDFNTAGDSAKAAQIYLDLLKRLPDSPLIREGVHARLTDIYLRGSDHKRAAEQLEEIIRDDPTNPAAYYYLGHLAFEEKKAAEAAEHFSKTVMLKPDFEQAYYELANAQI